MADPTAGGEEPKVPSVKEKMSLARADLAAWIASYISTFGWCELVLSQNNFRPQGVEEQGYWSNPVESMLAFLYRLCRDRGWDFAAPVGQTHPLVGPHGEAVIQIVAREVRCPLCQGGTRRDAKHLLYGELDCNVEVDLGICHNCGGSGRVRRGGHVRH